MTILSQDSPTLALLVFWDRCQCGERAPHTNKQFTDISRVLENSAQLWYYPEKEIRFHRLKTATPTPTFSCQLQAYVHCRKGPESGLLSNTQTNCMWRHTCWQSKGFSLEGAPGRRSARWGTQEGCSATWFHGDGVSFELSLANHADSGSFLVARASLGPDGFQRGGLWEVGWTYGPEPPLSFWSSPDSSDWP